MTTGVDESVDAARFVTSIYLTPSADAGQLPGDALEYLSSKVQS